MLAGLMLDDAEHVKGIRLIGLLGKDLLIEGGRLRKPAGLMMPDRQKVGLLRSHLVEQTRIRMSAHYSKDAAGSAPALRALCPIVGRAPPAAFLL